MKKHRISMEEIQNRTLIIIGIMMIASILILCIIPFVSAQMPTVEIFTPQSVAQAYFNYFNVTEYWRTSVGDLDSFEDIPGYQYWYNHTAVANAYTNSRLLSYWSITDIMSRYFNKTESDARYLQSYTETDPIFIANNVSIWTGINNKLNITDQRYNDTSLILGINTTLTNNKLDISDQRYNDTILANTKALPGNCPSGQVVQNTTTGGVQCVAMIGGGGTDLRWLNTSNYNYINSSYPQDINISGNITASYFLGDGSKLTGISAGGSVNAANVTAGTFGAGNFVFPNDLTVDTNTLLVNSTSKKVGIGIIPTQKLSVAGNILATTAATNPIYIGQDTGAGTFNVISLNGQTGEPPNTLGLAGGGNNDLYINAPTSGNIQLRPGGAATARAMFLANGDTQIKAASTGTSYHLIFGDETGAAQKSIYMEDWWLILQPHRNQGVKIRAVNGIGQQQTLAQFNGDAATPANQIVLLPDTVDAKVGIGIPTPRAGLEIDSPDVYGSWSACGGDCYAVNDTCNLDNETAYTCLYNEDRTCNDVNVAQHRTIICNTNNEIISGSLGIGTDLALYPLHVVGNAYIDGNLTIHNLISDNIYTKTEGDLKYISQVNEGNLNVNRSNFVGDYPASYFFPLNTTVSSANGFNFLDDVKIGGGFENNGTTLTSDGDIWMDGSLFLTGNISSTTIQAISVNGSWYPILDNTFDNGKANYRWKDLYALNGYFNDINSDLINTTDINTNTLTSTGNTYLSTTSGNVVIGASSSGASKLEVEGGAVWFNGTTGVTPVSGTGTRFMWIPDKKAIRAGYITSDQPTYWDDANIGIGSVAIGRDVRAIGTYSVAMGYNVDARGTASIALGKDSTAGDTGTVAIGTGASVGSPGTYNMAFGHQVQVYGGNDQIIIGSSGVMANAHNSIGLGDHVDIEGGSNNMQINLDTSHHTMTQSNTLAITGGIVGVGLVNPTAKFQVYNGTVLFNGATGTTPISGTGTRFMWVPAKSAIRAGYVTGNYWDDANIGLYSTAFGYDDKASGDYSTIGGGKGNEVSANKSTIAGGQFNIVGGDYSTIGGGDRNIVSGLYSTISGGSKNYVEGDYSWAGGQNMKLTADADRTFVWGYADSYVPIDIPDSFIIYSGNVAIGKINATAKLDVNGSAIISENLNVTKNLGVNGSAEIIGNLTVGQIFKVGANNTIYANPITKQVGINTDDIYSAYKFYVNGRAAISKNQPYTQYGTLDVTVWNSSSSIPGLATRAIYAGASSDSVETKYGLDSLAVGDEGDKIGVLGTANTLYYISGNNYGIKGYAQGANGTNNNYGVYGSISGKGYAGYFDGNTYITQNLTIADNLFTKSLTVNNLTGVGNAYACLNENGTLYRSGVACV